jgi:hypothetical protein
MPFVSYQNRTPRHDWAAAIPGILSDATAKGRNLFHPVIGVLMMVTFVLMFWMQVGCVVAVAMSRAKPDIGSPHAAAVRPYLPVQRLELVY